MITALRLASAHSTVDAMRNNASARGKGVCCANSYGIGTAWLDKVNFKQQCKDAGGNCDISHDEAFK